MIKNTRELLVFCFSMAFTGVSLLAMTMFHLVPYPLPAIVYVPALVAAAVLGLALLFGAGNEELSVDIWKLQRRLMRISTQSLPDTPTMTADAVLYVALTIEELSEAANTVSRILAHQALSAGDSRVSELSSHLHSIGGKMSQQATSIRIKLRDMPSFILENQLNLADATSLLDDVVDITVTAAGLGLAAGLPCPEGYAEVQRSNDSKKQPDTGMIRKTGDGKWIKGPDYTPPDLRSVVTCQWLRFEHEGKE